MRTDVQHSSFAFSSGSYFRFQHLMSCHNKNCDLQSSLLFQCCRGSGQFMIPSTTAPAQDCKPSSPMPSFQTRVFPPPSLSGVPIEYITDQLHNLAPEFWDKPDTADCTIIVPFPHAQGIPELPALSQTSVIEPSFTFTSTYENSTLPRRATQPPLNAVPRISMPLHIDYLSAHSSYLRGMFSGALPLNLMYSSTPPVSSSGIPADRLPRLMPCSPDHPILFLPVPDPTCFHLLIHWMYFGDLSIIQDCLHQGLIQWDGIARNVEYLGLNAEIKIFLGNWYHAWLDTEREVESCGEDSDTIYSDSEDEDMDDEGYSTVSDLDEMPEVDAEKAAAHQSLSAHQPESLQVQVSPSPSA